MTDRAEHLSRLVKVATPTLLGLAGVVLLALPLRLFEGTIPTPLLPLAVVFFWSVYGPSYLPAISVFAMGLLQDFLFGGPLGVWPAVYLALQYVAISQRSYFIGRDQKVVVLGFAVGLACVSLILWLVMSLMSDRLLPVSGLALQMLATLAIYPVLSTAFGRLHRRVIVEV